jgi:hypothetical protein
MKNALCTASALLMLVCAPALADDISEAITRASESYSAGDLNATRQALGEASQFLSQKTLDMLAGAFPDKVEGWSFDAARDSSTTGSYGAGNQISRTYTNGKNQVLSVQLTSDSPMIAQLGMIYANPQLAGSMGKLVYINKQRALQGHGGELTMLVNNRFMIVVSGDGSQEDKMALLSAMRFDKLQAL